MYKEKFEIGDQTELAFNTLLNYDFAEELPGVEHIRGFEGNHYFKDAVLTRAVSMGYTGQTDKDLIHFVLQYCKQAEVGLSRQTITNWLTQSAPTGSVNGRENVYRLCFALGMNERETAEFFLKALLEKPFHFKDIHECIYFFCLKAGQPFAHALGMIEKIEQFPVPTNVFSDDNTAQISDAILSIQNEEKLIAYITENKTAFTHQSQTVLRTFEELLKTCYDVATEENQCPIKTPDALLSVIYGYNARATTADDSGKRSTVLKESISKSDFPKYIKTNFPQRQQIENIRKGKASHDAIRKALIVLKFYSFFRTAENNKKDAFYLFDEFTDELDLLLEDCGYLQAYWRNPFDWMIGYCANSGRPLDTFRDLIESFYLSQIE